MTALHPEPEDGTGRHEGHPSGPLPSRRPVLEAVPVDSGDQVILVLVGDLDMSTDEVLRQAVADALGRHPASLALDVSALAFCDVRGLRALRWTLTRARAERIAVRILAADDQLRHLFTLAGARDLLAVARPHPQEKPAPAPAWLSQGDALGAALALTRDARTLRDQPSSVHDVLERAVRLAVAHVPGAIAAAASIHHPHTAPETLASHPLALAAEDAQHTHQQGPAHHARTHHGLVRIRDMGVEKRWPAFVRTARDLGITAAITCDLGHQQGSDATLTVYATAPAGFDPAAAEYTELLAAHATAALEATASITSLHTAMHSRQAIGEATGILMERHRIDAPAAFDLLARASQRTNVKLRRIAEHVVLTGQEPDQITLGDLTPPRPDQPHPSPLAAASEG